MKTKIVWIKVLLILITAFSCRNLYSQTHSFNFYYNSGKKLPSNLLQFYDSLKNWKGIYDMQVISVAGFADSIGSAESNLRLSRKRAVKVDSIIKSLNIPTSDYKIIANGEKFPAYPNRTLAGRSKNRHVEVKIAFSPRINPNKSDKWVYDIAIYPETKPKKDCDENDTIFHLPDGTEIEVKGCSLEDGVKTGTIRIEAKEYFTKDEMILNEMYTQTATGNCLSTGGMVRFRITDANGQTVKMKPKSEITIRIPATTTDTMYNLYDMKKGPNGENQGWELRNEKVNYLKDKKKFEIKLQQPTMSFNLDFIPTVSSSATTSQKKKPFLKTKAVKNGKSYVSGDASLLKLDRFKPKKFNLQKCDCIPVERQYVTVVANKKGKIYYTHTPITQLKIRGIIKKRIVVRKKDYVVLNDRKELEARVKSDFAKK